MAFNPPYKRLLAYAVLLIIPLVMTVLLLQVVFDVTITDYVPHHSDDMVYWHGIMSYKEVGFESGYYVYEERPSAAAFSPFGTHGPAYFAFMGTLARILGWQPYSMLIFNQVVVVAALIFYLYMVRPGWIQILLIGAVLLTYWPMLVYISMGMQESLHQAIAIVVAALFYYQFSQKEGVSWRYRVLVTALLMAFASLRLTWSLFLIPLLFFDVKPLSTRQMILRGGIALGLIGTAFLMFSYWSAPYPYSAMSNWRFALAESGFGSSITVLINNVRDNMSRILYGIAPEVLIRVQVLGVILVWLLVMRNQKKIIVDGKTNTGDSADHEGWFHVYNLAIILLLQVLIYDIFPQKDYRIFGMQLLVSIMLMIAFVRWRIVAVIVATNILVVAGFRDIHVYMNNKNFGNQESAAVFATELEGHIRYEPGADPWCNTVLLRGYDAGLASLEAGIGFGVTFYPTVAEQMLDWPARSQYMIWRDREFPAYEPYINVEPIAETSKGRLYLNLDADCEQARAAAQQ